MQTGWLDTAGDFYPCSVFDHIGMAEGIVNDLGLVSRTKYHADEILLENGWVQITRSLLGMKEQKVYWERFLTEYQKNFLRPYFEENDEPICSIAKMRWEYETDNN